MPTLSPPLETDGKVLKGHHVLFWLMGFFGLMFVVNGVFLWAALSSFPGEDVRHSYLQGLQYNQTQDSDIILDMQPVGSGEYRAALPVLAKGAWHVALNAEVADGRSGTGFKASKVIMVK